MNTFLIILLIICSPIWIISIIAWIRYFFLKKEAKDEIDKQSEQAMRMIYPDWPNVPRQKTNFDIFPLSMWND